MAAIIPDLDNHFGLTDKRYVQGGQASCLTTPGNFVDRATLKTALQVADATTYTDAVCLKLTKNDMVYALRRLTESTGV